MDEQRDRPRAAAEGAELERELGLPLRDRDAAPGELEALYGATLGALQQERGPRSFLRSRSTAQRCSLAVLVLAALVGITTAAFLRPDLGVYPAGRMAIALGVLGAGIALHGWLALRPLHAPPLPSWSAPLAVFCALLALAVLHALPAAHAAHPASLAPPGAELPYALRCVGAGIALGLAVFGALALLDRGGSRRALLFATAAGLTANLVQQLHCPMTAPSHMIAGHFGVALLLVAAALIANKLRAR